MDDLLEAKRVFEQTIEQIKYLAKIARISRRLIRTHENIVEVNEQKSMIDLFEITNKLNDDYRLELKSPDPEPDPEPLYNRGSWVFSNETRIHIEPYDL